jgi:hypothetical protein
LKKINPELWLLLFLVVIAAVLNFLVASQRIALVFYFLPTLYSAYHFGRRHATLTAIASIVMVTLLIFVNPAMFDRRIDFPFNPRWFDLTVWGGVLMVAGYATGSLYERNQKSLREMEEGYDSMLVILQNFLANQKYSDAHAYRVAMCATKIAEAVGLDAGSVEDVRTAALLFNMKELGIDIDVLCKAAQISQEEVKQGLLVGAKARSKAGAMGGALRRALPIFLAQRELQKKAGKIDDAPLEVQILVLAEDYEKLSTGERGAKISPAQARNEVMKHAANRFDSLVLTGFTKAFGGQTAETGAWVDLPLTTAREVAPTS